MMTQALELETQPTKFYDMQLPIRDSFPTFTTLEKAVCSHGLFLMAPNKWDPRTKSLVRPLRLSQSTSAMVRISDHPGSGVLVRVYGVRTLEAEEREAVVGQVRRMLRLSESEERHVRRFQELHGEAREKGFGRVFRSPTLFEDMVKAILFCNCQWPRTLSMAKALCDLQLELHASRVPMNTLDGAESFSPGTPAVKESQKKESQKKRKIQTVLSGENVSCLDQSRPDFNARMNDDEMANVIQLKENSVTNNVPSNRDETANGPSSSLNVRCEALPVEITGNFPSPQEITSLDEKYLSKRCGLGYRAGRILKLAQGVVEGRISLGQLEELGREPILSNYEKVEEKLKVIEGYGPFTCRNVLMCMGFYHVVPTDSETVRHLKQVHARTTTNKNVQDVVDEMYAIYEPYQFLAYWWEIWKFYEEWFGKFSEMPSSNYKLVTASNMKAKREKVKDQSLIKSRTTS